jgi:hypothetical protein
MSLRGRETLYPIRGLPKAFACGKFDLIFHGVKAENIGCGKQMFYVVIFLDGNVSNRTRFTSPLFNAKSDKTL